MYIRLFILQFLYTYIIVLLSAISQVTYSGILSSYYHTNRDFSLNIQIPFPHVEGNGIVTIRIVSDLITCVALWLGISIQNPITKRFWSYIKPPPHSASSQARHLWCAYDCPRPRHIGSTVVFFKFRNKGWGCIKAFYPARHAGTWGREGV